MSKKIIRKVLDSKEEWLKLRTSVITATEMSSLFSLNPYQSANKMFESKLNPKVLDNAYIRLGQILEPAVVMATNMVLGSNFKEERGIVFYLDDKSPVGATPDAIEKNTILECKTTSEKNFHEKWDTHPPLYYILQVHVQLLCTKRKVGYISVLPTNLTPTYFDEPVRIKCYKITTSKVMQDLIRDTATSAYEKFKDGVKYNSNRIINDQMKELLKESVEYIEL